MNLSVGLLDTEQLTKLHNASPFNDAYTQLFLIAAPRTENTISACQGELRAKVIGLSALCKNWKKIFEEKL